MIRHPPRSPLFPYTALFRSVGALRRRDRDWPYLARLYRRPGHGIGGRVELDAVLRQVIERLRAIPIGHAHDDLTEKDRKSTRLNSSHQIISYAVFCLKKKKK